MTAKPSIERWMNEQRRIRPKWFWFGFMLPVQIIITLLIFLGILSAIKLGWLR
jgi:hypothetical protein